MPSEYEEIDQQSEYEQGQPPSYEQPVQPEDQLEEEDLQPQDGAKDVAPPRGDPRRGKYFFEKRQERLNAIEGSVGALKQSIDEIKGLLATPRQAPQMPAHEAAIQRKIDRLDDLMDKRNFDPQAREILRELASVIKEQVAEQYVQPMAKAVFESQFTQEEQRLASEYPDPETGYAALKGQVMDYTNRYPGLSLTMAYSMLSRPLVEQRYRRMSDATRTQIQDGKKRMSDGEGRSSASSRSGSDNLSLDSEQKQYAERTYPNLPAQEAHKKFLEAYKRTWYQRTYTLPGDKLEDM
jgi:hypothetical protein